MFQALDEMIKEKQALTDEAEKIWLDLFEAEQNAFRKYQELGEDLLKTKEAKNLLFEALFKTCE